jgi:hypothetical protein
MLALAKRHDPSVRTRTTGAASRAGRSSTSRPSRAWATARPTSPRPGSSTPCARRRPDETWKPAKPFVLTGAADARAKALNCLTQAVYYEAGFEPGEGQIGRGPDGDQPHAPPRLSEVDLRRDLRGRGPRHRLPVQLRLRRLAGPRPAAGPVGQRPGRGQAGPRRLRVQAGGPGDPLPRRLRLALLGPDPGQAEAVRPAHLLSLDRPGRDPGKAFNGTLFRQRDRLAPTS